MLARGVAVRLAACGELCTIQVRPAFKFRPNGREYARLDVGRELRRAQVALFAIRKGRSMKLYVIPLNHLRNISSVYIPASGKCATDSSKKPQKDWTRYEGVDLLADGHPERFTYDDR